MRIALVCIQEYWGQCEGPEENASCYTVRPGTFGLTLDTRLDCVAAIRKTRSVRVSRSLGTVMHGEVLPRFLALLSQLLLLGLSTSWQGNSDVRDESWSYSSCY
jgi:hypothetical protein